jgi:serine/threonine-protein kinase HipA
MTFNIIARNHDDHAKNFAFLFKNKKWELAPAYDLAYSYKPGSKWVNSHWMTLNGKRDDFNREDFYSLEKISPLFGRKFINQIIDETIEQVSNWRKLATENEVPDVLIKEVETNLRLNI